MRSTYLAFLCCCLSITAVHGQLAQYPYVQNFENFGVCGANCLFSCNLIENWENASNDQTDWSVWLGQTQTVNTGPQVDFSQGTQWGKYLYLEASNGCAGEITGSVLTPFFDLSNLQSPQLSFAYHLFGDGQGSLHIDANKNGQWVKDIVPPLRDNVNKWQVLYTCLEAFAGESNVQFRFRGVTGEDVTSDMAIDAFSIYDAFANELALKEVVVSGCGLDSQTPITVNLQNLGRLSAVNMSVQYSVNGAPFTSPEKISQPLQGCEERHYTFKQLANLSAQGWHTIRAVVSTSPKDPNSANDTLSVTVRNIPTVTDLPYTEDFERGGGNWITGGRFTSWQWGTPNNTWVGSAADGQKAWVSNLNGQYANKEFSYLESPCFDFSQWTVDPILSFMHVFELEYEWDMSWVEYSLNGGKHWQKLGTATTGLSHWYNDTDKDVWTGNSSGGQNEWQMAAHVLTGMAGQVVRFRYVLRSDDRFAYEGVGVDHIRISLPYDVGVTEIISPIDTCGVSTRLNQTVRIRIENRGFYPTKNLSLSYLLAGSPASQPEVLTTPLLGEEEIVFSFADKVDLATTGAHLLVISAVHFPDDDFSNNQVSKTVGNYPNPIVDIGKDTLLCGLDILTLDPGLVGPNTYRWSTGDTTRTLAADLPGLYKLELTDRYGCKGKDSLLIDKMPALGVDVKWIEHVRCYGDATGAMEVMPQGGTPPLAFRWTDGAQGFTLSHLTAGNYGFELVDQAGCRLDDEIEIRQNDSLVIHVDLIRNAGCPIDSSGAIYLSMTGGEAPYSFLWNTGAITQNLPRLPEGNYRTSVIDKNGCSVVSPVYEITTHDTMPRASFTYQLSGGTVIFQDSSQNAIQYYWTFGDDSSPVTDINPKYTYRRNGSYKVKLIAVNSCGSDTVVKTINVISVGAPPPLPETEITVFPNPVKADRFFLDIEHAQFDQMDVILFDASGKMVLQDKLGPVFGTHRQEIHVPYTLANGLYLLAIQTTEGRLAKRLLITR